MANPQKDDQVYLSERLIREWMEEYRVWRTAERVKLVAQLDEFAEKIRRTSSCYPKSQ